MEKFYKTNLIKVPKDFYKNDIDMQIIEWWAQDEEDENEEDDDISNESNSKNTEVYTIRCFGVTKSGISVTCKITGFKPYYYVKVPSSFTRVHLSYFLKHIESGYMLRNFKDPLVKENGKHRSCIEQKKDLFGFRNGKEYKYVKLVFNNYSAMMKSRYLFKKAIEIQNVTKRPTKFKLYESNFEPFMRYCHIKDILMAGWIRLPKGKYSITKDTSSSQIEISIDRRSVVSMKEHKDLANFLQASWDIEVYSYDRTFPDPEFKTKDSNGNIIYPNEIFQIATTYKYVDKIGTLDETDGFLVKHLLTLKKCDKIDDQTVIVEECKTEKELIKRWVDIVSEMDPDIFYTYNGDSFDCMYLVERAVLCGLASKKKSGSKTVYSGYVLKKLSRMIGRQAEIKKEYFSSSAYGDSEFNRIYIPGRLNYDLLIHYKRGMKKYSSYKLDNIASEVLKQNKHDVSAKELFDYYQQGDPDKIKLIGEYCFVEGTRVSLPSCTVDIKCLENMNTNVITWVEDKGFSTSEKVHFFNNGEKDCLQLTLLDGTQIKCTKDHKFLTKNGWIEAQNLKSTDKILFSPEPAYIDYEKEKIYTFEFSELIGKLSYEKSSIFCRILGYLLTDGGISESTCYKNYSSGKVKYIYDTTYINLGTKFDAENMQKDIFKLIGKLPAINKAKYTYRITLPMELTKWILSLDGIKKGKRIDSPAILPKFILNDKCPLWIIREFLKGLMGGDGYCPCFTKTDNKFSSVAYSQSKTYEQLNSLNIYMNQLQILFKKFDINTIISNVIKNDKGEGYTQKLKIKQDDIIIFYEKIGYSYCAGKSYKLSVASSYYKLKRETKRQYNWVCNRVNILKKNMKIKDALKQAHNELKEKEPIFNTHYSLPNIESIDSDIKNQNDILASSCKFKKIYFPSVEEYLKLTESYDKFVTGDTKKSHSIKQDATYSPCYYLSILDKKDIGKHTVYDIEVKDTHNFIANGAVVHNCIQDTALLQRLVDKQLILTNIMQLANVTFVPIGFLTTRGQTIKVFSQVLRKARQMNFLVPHTNFNEDAYPVYIKLKEPHNFDTNDIGEYIEINCGESQVESSTRNPTRKLIINGRLSELVDDNTIIVLSDTELQKEFYNIKFKYRRSDYNISRMWSNEDAIDDSFTGATVLEPICGMYADDNVAVLDFASLYPTIMISRNLCYSSFVLDDQYLGIPDVNYETIKWDDRIEYKLRQKCEAIGKSGKSKGQVCGKQAFFEIDGKYYCRIHDTLKKERTSDEKFQKRDVSYNYTIVQPHVDENGDVINKGVLPALLEELYAERKRVKREMATAAAEGNKLLESILDSTQLAIKVSLNSTYGFLGRGQGNLILKELGSIVTAVGRMLIEQSKEYAEGPFIEYIKENGLLQHKLEYKPNELTQQEKQNILKLFSV
jgi:DNA polymerase elongation subunit (family B)/intein/homing endonuclease